MIDSIAIENPDTLPLLDPKNQRVARPNIASAIGSIR